MESCRALQAGWTAGAADGAAARTRELATCARAAHLNTRPCCNCDRLLQVILNETTPMYVWLSLLPIVAGCSVAAMKEVRLGSSVFDMRLFKSRQLGVFRAGS